MTERIPSSSDVAERLAALPPDVLVADYHVGPDWVNLHLLRGGRVAAHRIAYSPSSLPRLETLSPRRSRGLGRNPTLPPAESSCLVEPILDRAEGCSTIYLVTHGPLEHYALHALGVGARTLIDLAPVVYVLSLGRVPLSIAGPPQRLDALVLGNMTGDLPGAESEANEVASLLGTEAFVRKAATLRRLERELAGKNLLHIAGHGYFDPAHPHSSGIPFPDGILTVRHVNELELADFWVVLSGCVTGLGDERPGEGFSSLVGAFFRAGARGLLVSLWDVDDAVAKRFMVGLYRRVVGGLGFSHALRRSYLELKEDTERRYGESGAYYWAPFKAVGKW